MIQNKNLLTSVLYAASLLSVIFILSSCRETLRTELVESKRVLSHHDKMYLLLSKASDGELYPAELNPKEDYSLLVFDHQSDEIDLVTVGINLGSRDSRQIQTAHGGKNCLALLETVKLGASVKLFDKCCVLMSWRAPSEEREVLYKKLKSMNLTLLEEYRFKLLIQYLPLFRRSLPRRWHTAFIIELYTRP